MTFPILAALALTAGPSQEGDVGPLVRAVWLLQRYGMASAVDPANDQRLKGVLFKALGKEGELTAKELEGFMDADTFKALAGADELIDASDISKAIKAATPQSRERLLPTVKEHIDSLTASFDLIDETHRLAGEKLVEWIVKNYKPGQPLDVVVVCTGNSRRSILGSTMGNVAASYFGMPEVRFHSGGTAPTAFNTRTVTTLKVIGIEIDATGKEAERGEAQTPNPIYRIRWGLPDATAATSMEATEFSKHYDDAANPKKDFAALMVCGEA